MDVLSLGIYVVDVLGRPIDEFPEKGKLVLFDELEIHTGGCANNTAIALTRLGLSAGAMGKVGTDAFGDLILQKLRDNGVDTVGMQQDPGSSTSFTFVAVASDGERTFYHYIGANGELCEADLDWEVIKSAKILHIAGALVMPRFDGAPMANVLQKAKTLGITTSLDTAYDATGKWMETLEPCLPYVDMFMPSIVEAEHLTGLSDAREIAQFLRRSYGIHTIAIKMGEDGSYVSTPEREHFATAYPVTAVDATGAGDAYVAGFLAGTLMGWDLKATAELASATGAACVTAIGTTAGIQNLEETLKICQA
ncbi:sugar kinase [Candidatus Poribacteria bacterium]|nr:sugar kinase [Candidatus Poribacteria bacterium]MYA55901.1 sugar kinase [Candidatus Poribacteria bacterium]